MERVKQKLKTNALVFPERKAKTSSPKQQFSSPPINQTGRWLCIHLPLFPLEVLTEGLEISLPFSVVEGNPKSRLLVCNAAALKKGLQKGMSVSAAFALANDLQIKERDEVAEKAALEALAGWVLQFTSVVSLEPPQALLLEIGGSERLFGGVEVLSDLIEQGLRQLGYTPGMAIAPTPLAALLLSRAGSRVVSRAHSMTGDLARVALEDAGLDAKVVDTLHTLGLRTFADCYRLPRDGLARRVGPQVVTFLDKVLGKSPDPRLPYVVPKRFERYLSLPEEIETLEALLFALHRLLLELTGMLRASDDGVQELTITLSHRKNPPTRVDVLLLSPSRDEAHLQALVKERLEQISLPSPVECIGIKTREFASLAPEVLDFFDTSNSTTEDWPRLIEKLDARLGRGCVYRLNVSSEYRPERAWEAGDFCISRMAVATGFPEKNHPHLSTLPEEEQEIERFSQGKENLKNRPLWLLPKPLLLRTQNHRPQLHGLLHFPHPCERIESGWWDGNDVSRDYFMAANAAGERFWIFRDRRAPYTWYLHGIFA